MNEKGKKLNIEINADLSEEEMEEIEKLYREMGDNDWILVKIDNNDGSVRVCGRISNSAAPAFIAALILKKFDVSPVELLNGLISVDISEALTEKVRKAKDGETDD